MERQKRGELGVQLQDLFERVDLLDESSNQHHPLRTERRKSPGLNFEEPSLYDSNETCSRAQASACVQLLQSRKRIPQEALGGSLKHYELCLESQWWRETEARSMNKEV